MNPSGLCKCGCGRPTLPAKRTDKRRGYIIGMPVDYVLGHHGGMRPFGAPPEDRVCIDCNDGVVQPWEDFYVKKRWPDGSPRTTHSYCRRCNAKRQRGWRRDNPEKRRVRQKRHRVRVAQDPERHATQQAYQREWYRRANDVNPAHYRGKHRDPFGAQGMVESALVLAVVQASRVTSYEIAQRIGVDESAVRRSLHRRTMHADKAVAILRALDIAPAEIGL